MINMSEMSEDVSLRQQMEESDVRPVILINKFTVAAEDVDAMVEAWKRDADFFRGQPGYISTQLHKGIGESRVFINYAEWRSVEDFKNAFNQPEFINYMKQYPDSVVASPHLFEKVSPWSN